jgi:hypothetical protein
MDNPHNPLQLKKSEKAFIKRDARLQRKNLQEYLDDIEEKRPYQPASDDVVLEALMDKCWPSTLGMLQ